MNSFVSITILLAVSSISAYLMGDYNAMTWDILYPELNASLVEFCFFNKPDWINEPESANGKWCQVVVSPNYDDYIRYPDQLVRPLADLYKQHLVNEQNDQKQVLNCFVANRFKGNTSDNCDKITITNLIGKTLNRREARAKSYLEMLSNVANQIDLCWEVINSTGPTTDNVQPFECVLVSDVLLVTHCSLYHTSKLMPGYEACGQVTNPLTSTPPTDFRSIVRYLGWANITASNERDMTPFNDHPDKYKRYQHVLNKCFHSNDWLDNPEDWCHKIAKPVETVKYSWLNQRMQKEWQRVIGKLIQDDCTLYHKDQLTNSTSVCFAKSSDP